MSSFRRHVRPFGLWYTPELPLDLVKEEARHQLNERKHTVIETSWADAPDPDDFMSRTPQRILTVRYVTGGMRHGLGPSIEFPNGRPDVIEFAR